VNGDGVVGKDSTPGLELQKLSVGDLLAGMKRLSLSSALWLVGGLSAVFVGTWTGAVWYEAKFGSPTLSAPSVKGPGIVYPRSGGITDVVEDFSNEQLKQFLSNARSQLTVVVPWFIDPLTIADALKQILATDGAAVTVFFLDPSSPHLAERGRVARPDLPNYGPGETRRSIAVLGPLFSSARADAEMRTYNSGSAPILRTPHLQLYPFGIYSPRRLQSANWISYAYGSCLKNSDYLL
jgi:hypothetical protein